MSTAAAGVAPHAKNYVATRGRSSATASLEKVPRAAPLPIEVPVGASGARGNHAHRGVDRHQNEQYGKVGPAHHWPPLARAMAARAENTHPGELPGHPATPSRSAIRTAFSSASKTSGVAASVTTTGSPPSGHLVHVVGITGHLSAAFRTHRTLSHQSSPQTAQPESIRRYLIWQRIGNRRCNRTALALPHRHRQRR